MSNRLECLCYTKTNTAGQSETVYCAYIGGFSTEQIQTKIDKLRAEGRKEVRALTWAEYEAVTVEESKGRYNVNVPTVIDRALFTERFNVLPPCRWEKYESAEIFYISEAIIGNIHSFYVRIGKGDSAKYFEINAQTSSKNSELFEICGKAANSGTADLAGT